ncbi:MAG TPA: GFA family protein [Kofleriaceae bacterium]|nr:GFA family protein [Kofleriaceae bacterium]
MSSGGCHCGKIRFEVRGAPSNVLVCNCSICTKRGYLHWIVPLDAFRITAGEGELGDYRFGTGVARHYFCPVCACAPFYVPRSDPDKMDVNVRCLDEIDLDALTYEGFDGKNWEQHYRDVYRRG